MRTVKKIETITRTAWYILKYGDCSRMYMNNKVKTIPIDCHVRRSQPKNRPLIFSGMMGWRRANQLPIFIAVPRPNKNIPTPIIQILKFSGKILAKISKIKPNKEKISPMLPINFLPKKSAKKLKGSIKTN